MKNIKKYRKYIITVLILIFIAYVAICVIPEFMSGFMKGFNGK